MTILRRFPRRLWALGLLAALLAQIELPAAHAVETASSAGGISADARASASPGLVVADDRPAPAHDPARCPVCQSLHRANPAVSTPACGEPLLADASAALAAGDPLPHARPARSGHPPRAPPAHPIHLV